MGYHSQALRRNIYILSMIYLAGYSQWCWWRTTSNPVCTLTGAHQQFVEKISRFSTHTSWITSCSNHQTDKAHLSYVCLTRLAYCVGNLTTTPSQPGRASWFGQVCWLGVPHSCHIFSNWSKSEVPGKIGRRENISPSTHLLKCAAIEGGMF